jgi:hypothetical protein
VRKLFGKCADLVRDHSMSVLKSTLRLKAIFTKFYIQKGQRLKWQSFLNLDRLYCSFFEKKLNPIRAKHSFKRDKSSTFSRLARASVQQSQKHQFLVGVPASVSASKPRKGNLREIVPSIEDFDSIKRTFTLLPARQNLSNLAGFCQSTLIRTVATLTGS